MKEATAEFYNYGTRARKACWEYAHFKESHKAVGLQVLTLPRPNDKKNILWISSESFIFGFYFHQIKGYPDF